MRVEEQTAERSRNIVHIHLCVISQPKLYRTLALPLHDSRYLEGFGRFNPSEVDTPCDRDPFECSNDEISLVVQPHEGDSSSRPGVFVEEKRQSFEN